jgi:hypothetical protein
MVTCNFQEHNVASDSARQSTRRLRYFGSVSHASAMKGQAHEPTQSVTPGSAGPDVFAFQILKPDTMRITFEHEGPPGTVAQTTSVGVMVTPTTGGQAQTFAITSCAKRCRPLLKSKNYVAADPYRQD